MCALNYMELSCFNWISRRSGSVSLGQNLTHELASLCFFPPSTLVVYFLVLLLLDFPTAMVTAIMWTHISIRWALNWKYWLQTNGREKKWHRLSESGFKRLSNSCCCILTTQQRLFPVPAHLIGQYTNLFIYLDFHVYVYVHRSHSFYCPKRSTEGHFKSISQEQDNISRYGHKNHLEVRNYYFQKALQNAMQTGFGRKQSWTRKKGWSEENKS